MQEGVVVAQVQVQEVAMVHLQELEELVAEELEQMFIQELQHQAQLILEVVVEVLIMEQQVLEVQVLLFFPYPLLTIQELLQEVQL
jgi:hypothetical protein